MELDNSRLKAVAETIYSALTKKLRARPMPSTLRVLASGNATAAFSPSTAPFSRVEVRRTFAAIEIQGFSLEDILESYAILKTVAQGRLRHFNVTLAFVADDTADTLLFACNFCPELGTFDFRPA